ncbi:MAG: hypothetical protein HOO96_44080 [Polyangiaceae bacterium]|nr:hypothetical protein [Polyangiaceae bacterium]
MMPRLSLAVVPVLAVLAACGGPATPTVHRSAVTPAELEAERSGNPPLDACLGDGRRALDEPALAAVRATWQQVVSGRAPSSIAHLRGYGTGRCVSESWQPVTPRYVFPEDGESACPNRVALVMPEVGNVEIDARTGRGRVDEPETDVQVYALDEGRTLTSRRTRTGAVVKLLASGVETPIAARSDGAGVVRVLDDHRIVVDEDVLDLRTKARLHVKSATVFVASPSAPKALAAYGAQLSDAAPYASIIGDGQGRTLARLDSKSIPSNTVVALGTSLHEEGVAVASFDDATHMLKIAAFVRGGSVVRKTATIGAGPLRVGTNEMWLRGVGNRDAVALGLAHKLVVWRLSEPAPLVVAGFGPDLSPRGAEATFVLDGGKVVVASYAQDSFIIDATNGTILGRGPTSTLRFTRKVAMLEEPSATPDRSAVVVSSDGAVRRGRVGSALVGRFSIPTYIDQADPWLVCEARALTALPPMVMYPMEGTELPPDPADPASGRRRARGNVYALASTLGFPAPAP